MKVITNSNSIYEISTGMTPKGNPCLIALKEGCKEKVYCLAVWPDRLPFMEATKTVNFIENGLIIGYNQKGVITVRIKPHNKPLNGMLLIGCGPSRCFRSTKIKETTM